MDGSTRVTGSPGASEVDVASELRRDRRVVWATFGFVALTSAVGGIMLAFGSRMTLGAPPLFAGIRPHLGPGTVPAVALGWLGFRYAPALAQLLPWRRLLLSAYLSAVAWTASLALIDGWQRGWAGRLATPDEYLPTAAGITDPGAFLRSFTSHIIDFRPGSFPTHVSGHPPLATLVFWALDRIGLSGGGWAGLVVILMGSSAGIAVAVTISACAAPMAARQALPGLVFFPGAIWIGVSADGLFAGVAAWGIALAVLGVRRGRIGGMLTAVGGGLLLGATVYLSYGLLLMGIVVVAALILCLRAGVVAGDRPAADRVAARIRLRAALENSWRWIWVAVGVAAVAAAMTTAGFDWFRGESLLTVRYYQGIASDRPYAYFVWANFAALAISAGPAVAAGLGRAVPVVWRRRWSDSEQLVPAVLACAALIAVICADLTGLSRAETERIWLPFGIWLVASFGLLPRRSAKWALGVQIVVALVINHLTLTNW